MPTFATGEPISVLPDLYVADVRITASERTDTEVEVEAEEEATVGYTHGTLEVNVPRPRAFAGRRSAAVRIELPAGSRRVWLGGPRRDPLPRPIRRLRARCP